MSEKRRMSEKRSVSYIIHARWIVPVIPSDVVHENHALVIDKDQILDLLPSGAANDKYQAETQYDLEDHVVIPGLVNTHGHAAMTLLRGYADDKDLMDWLNNHIWPVEGEFVDSRFVEDGTSLAIAEMIRTGTTCAADTYFFPEASARTFQNHHFRAQVCMPVVKFSNAWASDEESHIHKGLDVHDEYRSSDLITTAFAPHSPYTVTDSAFSKILTYSEELQIPIHLHLHETASEVEESMRNLGKRPLQRMDELNILSPALQAVHMTQLSEDEMDLLALNNVQVAHCPESNLKLASGFCRVEKLKAKGINVGLGTDGAASNNNLDMLEEMRTATLMAKALSLNATSLNATDTLAMATIDGARLLGLDDRIGSLEPGKLADVTVVDMSDVSLQPVYHPVSQLIYTTTGHQVSHVWINGRLMLDNMRYTELDPLRLYGVANEWKQKIQG